MNRVHRSALTALFVAGMSSASASLAQTPQSWRIAPQPAVSIGQVAGDSPAAFGNVVGLSASGDLLAVADGQSLEIKVFDRQGNALAASGRAGGGPGEYRTIKSIHRCGSDSLFVYDPAAMRLSVLNSRGKYARAIDVRSFAPSGAAPYEMSCNADGVFAFVHRAPAPPGGIGPRRPSVSISMSTLERGNERIGTFPASERYFDGTNDFPRPLGKHTSVSVGPKSIVIATGDGDSLEVLSIADGKRRAVGIVRPSRRLTREHIASFVEDQIARRAGRADTASLRRLYESVQYPVTLPPYRRVLVDLVDRIWIEDFPLPGDRRVRWTVLGGDGRVLATLDSPSNFEIHEIGRDTVRGLWRDELGVQWVREYRVDR